MAVTSTCAVWIDSRCRVISRVIWKSQILTVLGEYSALREADVSVIVSATILRTGRNGASEKKRKDGEQMTVAHGHKNPFWAVDPADSEIVAIIVSNVNRPTRVSADHFQSRLRRRGPVCIRARLQSCRKRLRTKKGSSPCGRVQRVRISIAENQALCRRIPHFGSNGKQFQI
jgi:hypothetical protein